MADTALRFAIRDRASLTDGERERMLQLMQLCYDNVERARFFSDLDDKQQVIVLEGGGAIQGFSTVRIAEETLEGRRVDILFSGDTVIHPDSWGSKALQRGFLALTIRHKLKSPRRRLYWLLLSKGYKTYLLLTNNFPTAFPRRGHAPAPAVRALRDRVATAWWGAQYDPARELLRYDKALDRLKPGVASLDAETRAAPDVAYFLERNPGFDRGDELVCFAEIDFALAVRFAGKQLRRVLLGLGRAPGRRATP